jgi:hypothetical protein
MSRNYIRNKQESFRLMTQYQHFLNLNMTLPLCSVGSGVANARRSLDKRESKLKMLRNKIPRLKIKIHRK